MLVRALDEAVSRRNVRVPPYPSTAMQLQAVLARDEYDVEELVEAMRTDQAFTGNLLRLANSPLYRRGGEVRSVSNAVMRVGARELTRLAMAAAVSATTLGGSLQSIRRLLWRRSLAAASVSETLAPFFKVESGEAFVAGLLHEVGKVLALQICEEVLAKHHEPAVDEPMVMRQIERTQRAFGAMVAERWQLPTALAEVISSVDPVSPLGEVVQQADRIVASLEEHRQVNRAMLEALGINAEAARELEHALPRVPAFLSALDGEQASAAVPPNATTLKGRHREWLCVEPTGGGRAEPWPVRHFETHFIEANVAVMLQVGGLLELNLTPAGLRFWAVVERVEAHGGSWLTVFRPFALSMEAAQQWDAVVAERRSAA